MKTAQELAAMLETGSGLVRSQLLEAAAMLIQQAEQIEALKADADRIRECASRLVEHADFRLGGILSADSKAKDIPSRATSQVKARHLASLRDALKPSDAMKGKS